ncbi:MAG: sulfate permease [Balneolaceae bacterium]
MGAWHRTFFKITDWISGYTLEDAAGDLKGGLTTGFILIPQGMAYAVIAGVPPIYGLYAGLIPLLIYPLFTTSRHLSIGPVAIDMLIVAAGFGAVAASVNNDYLGYVLLLTLITGILQLGMGLLRLGSLFNFFSRPVISGFVMAAPLIIALTQLENLFGIQLNGSHNMIRLAGEFLSEFNHIHLATLWWGVASMAVLLLLKRVAPKWPGSVLVLGLSLIAAWLSGIEQQNVAIVGSIPAGLPPLSLPPVGYESVTTLLPTALTLALVQFMTITSLSNLFAKRHGYLVDSSQELVSLGASNITGSFFSSLPVSSSISRSAASEQAGARTPLSNVITAVIILLTLLFLTPLFYYLPMPVLASIIIVAVFGLIDIEELKFLIKTRKSEGGIALFTFFCTLFIGIQEGILLGIGVSMLVMLVKVSRPDVAELGVIPNTRSFKNLKRNPDARRIDGILILRIDASFSFMNAEFFRDFILEKSRQQSPDTRHVIIDGSSMNMLDTTAIDSLISIIKTLRQWEMDLYLTGLKGPIRDIIHRSGFEEYLGSDHFHRTPHMAVKRILQILDEEDDGGRSNQYESYSF